MASSTHIAPVRAISHPAVAENGALVDAERRRLRPRVHARGWRRHGQTLESAAVVTRQRATVKHARFACPSWTRWPRHNGEGVGGGGMRYESSVTSVSWIPSEAVDRPAIRAPFDWGVLHYDEPPPSRIDDLEALRRADRFRFANRDGLVSSRTGLG
jgi:hypothetical protein